jgi:hypothetical protein
MTSLFLITYVGVTLVLPLALLAFLIVEAADSISNLVSKQNEKN